MNRDEIRDAVRLSLVTTDDGRACHHSSYALKRRLASQEREARNTLYPPPRVVSNVVPFHRRPEHPGPEAA